MTVRLAVAAVALAAGLSAGLAAEPRLKPVATVTGDVVRLADLVEHAGAAGQTILFGAPQPGQSGTIATARLVAAAADHGVTGISTDGLAHVAVRRLAREVRSEEIAAAVRHRLVAEHGVAKDQEIELNAGQLTAEVETAANGPVVVRSLSLNSAAGRFEATYVVEGSRALEARPARVVGSLPDVVRVPVLAKAVLKGDTVGPEDFTLERRRRADVPADAVTDTARLVGFAARRALGRGATPREGDLQRPELVERNATVTILYESGGLSLALRGRANAAGALGETIQVTNLQSKRVLDAVVTGSGRVTVKSPERPARAAAATQPALN